ncbi:hypothetical protein [Jiangella asiatica]|uniref:Uncharacterized protein n=1 Tax=Jiangella asiatica TaxID=2530372 RepID=A0A4V2Z131_9ACTN|nr:hypothetical protein [Jiangella asiatica]TDE03448.1 hypothetical protein E1269_20645 [Jiangella asiatica]
MARDHARIEVGIWSDPDFICLDPADQHMYLLLVTSPRLSYCGVIDYVPARFTGLAKGITPAKLKARLDSLAARRFLVIDYGTAEILVRSYVRHDGLLKLPNVTKAMASALMAVVSPVVRDTVVAELARARREEPDAKGWEGLAKTYPRLLEEIDAKGSTNPSENPSGKG